MENKKKQTTENYIKEILRKTRRTFSSEQKITIGPEPDDKHKNKIYAEGFPAWANTLKYDIQWICDMDMDNYVTFSKSKILIIIGHNEYWTREARLNFDRFVEEGKNALVLSGNTMWWKVRYTADKTGMICYKDKKLDPIMNPLLKTINWSDTSLHFPIINSIGADWIHGGYGDQGCAGVDAMYRVYIPNSPLLEGTNKNRDDGLRCKTREFDGIPALDYKINGCPVPDTNLLKFCMIEIIAADGAKNLYNKRGNGSLFLFKKTPYSGIIINASSTEWCSGHDGINGVDSLIFRKITINAIHKLLKKENVFSTDIPPQFDLKPKDKARRRKRT
ncbi:MAG: N,N-dimethylformamidase beta subunit family domain-containing protein [Flavobacteriales bacterium]